MGEFKEGDLKVLSIRKGIHGFIIRTKFKNGEKSFHIYEDGTWKDKDGYAQLFEIVKLGDN